MKLDFTRNLAVRIIAAACTPIVVVGLLLVIVPRFTELPGDVAFRVYGADVTKTELKHRMDLLKALYGIAPPQDAAQQDTFRRQSAEAIVLSTVLDHAAHDEGVTVEDKDARQALLQMVNGRFQGGMTGFAQTLATVGASENDVVNEMKRQQATSLVFEKVTAQQGAAGQVTDAEAHAYYDQHPREFQQPEARHLRNIVVSSEDEANQVLAQARGGADFVALAKQFSLDESTRDTGGDLGFVSQDQLEQPVAGPAFATPVGGVFGPAQSAHGWNVGQVLEARPALQQPYDQVRQQLTDQLTSRKALDYWRTWLAGRVKSADVEYADAYQPAKGGSLAGLVPAEPGEASPAAQQGSPN